MTEAVLWAETSESGALVGLEVKLSDTSYDKAAFILVMCIKNWYMGIWTCFERSAAALRKDMTKEKNGDNGIEKWQINQIKQ